MPLRGIKVIELAGLAPGPFCGMVLSDFGAQVIRVDKTLGMDMDCLANGKQSLALNLKDKKGVQIFRKLCKTSDVVVDTYRAGVMESLGLGPDVLLKENPKLIYARLTGYGQYGPLAKRAGHDTNYLALTGILSMLHRYGEKPLPPLNILADFGGGGLMCALGIVLALFERTISGKGQIIDSNMVEGAAYLSSWIYRSKSLALWDQEAGKNVLDGGAHYYEIYKTKDDKYMTVGAIEPQFYTKLLQGLNLTQEECPQYGDFEKMSKIFERKFAEKTQQEWIDIFENTDACVTPVLTWDEATQHAHNKQRNTFVKCSDQDNLIPAPAPKLSRTPGQSQALKPKLKIGANTKEILKSLKYSEKEIAELESNDTIHIYRQSKM